jgi:predicted transcriptional regulator
MKLTSAEEQVMNYLWELKKAYMKDLVNAFPDPKPAYTTIATLLKRMTDKGFVRYNQHGKAREYYPVVRKPAYFSKKINTMIRDFFDNSSAQFASFFTNETDLSLEELEELKRIVEQQIDDRK